MKIDNLQSAVVLPSAGPHCVQVSPLGALGNKGYCQPLTQNLEKIRMYLTQT